MTRAEKLRPSPRIEALKGRVLDDKERRARLHATFDRRRPLYEQAWSDHSTRPRIIRIAHGLASFLQEKEVFLEEDDLLAGYTEYLQHQYFVLPDDREFPYANVNWGWPGIRNVDRQSPEEVQLLKHVDDGYKATLYQGYMGGHVIGGYDRVLESGLGALAAQATAKAVRSEGAEREYATACQIVCKAASAYVQRYSAKALEMAQAALKEHREQLEQIAAACQWIAVNPPCNFFEALQLVWLTHEIIVCEQHPSAISLGRLDQYLYPFYARDMEAGVISPQEAGELIDALWVKLGTLVMGFQHVTLGGLGPDGEYAANDLSYMCLRASRKLMMDQPAVGVRWHPSIPSEFWTEVQELIRAGIGFPALFNDNVCIPALKQRGVSEKDAQNYAVVGCVELSVPGKEFTHTVERSINWGKLLELMFNGGVCAISGQPFQLKAQRDLNSMHSFGEFYAWYKEELAHAIDVGVRAMNVVDRDYAEHAYYLFLSSTMADCLERGRDAVAGGTLYGHSSVINVGMANVVDGLVAIKHLVFEEKRVTLSELAEALLRDFKGWEALRSALTRYPRYGNDDDEPDSLMKDLVDGVGHQLQGYRNPRGGGMYAAYFSSRRHVQMGELTGALPDGRRSGQPLANGLGPAQGADTAGPTAVVKSVTKPDHTMMSDGMVLDLKFHPALFEEQDGQDAFRHLLSTYFQLGGLESQINVVSKETLLAAQQSPEDYHGLLIRVSGFSAYFVNLDKRTQDEIISRTEYGGT